MKVILVSGSPRIKGNTMAALKACAESIENNGIKTHLISLAGKKIEACQACGQCKKLGYCVLKDDFAPILDEVKNSRGFVIGAPVYFGTARGDVMNLLQRLGMVSRGGEKFLKHQIGGPVAVARRGGQTASIQEMLMFYFINGMTVVGADYWNMLFGGAPEEVLNDREGMENILEFGKNIARLIKLEANAKPEKQL